MAIKIEDISSVLVFINRASEKAMKAFSNGERVKAMAWINAVKQAVNTVTPPLDIIIKYDAMTGAATKEMFDECNMEIKSLLVFLGNLHESDDNSDYAQ